MNEEIVVMELSHNANESTRAIVRIVENCGVDLDVDTIVKITACVQVAMNEMAKKDIIIIWSEGDWEGLYINGRLKHQNHSVTLRDFTKAVGIEIQRKQVNEAYAYKHGRFPDNLEDCPLFVKE